MDERDALRGMDLNRLRAVCRSVLADELKHLQDPERQEPAQSERTTPGAPGPGRYHARGGAG